MATWIAHLRLAEDLLQRFKEFDPSEFAIGSLAPDSGVWNEATKRFEPPVETTHFLISREAPWPYADLKFYREYLANGDPVGPDAGRSSFLWGYFFHLVADNLWYQRIARPTKARFAAEFASDPEFVWEVKRDWYGLDLQYVRSHPDAFYWRVFLQCEYRDDYVDFLPPEAVNQRLEFIKSLYRRTDDEFETRYGDRPKRYLSEGEMDAYLEEAAHQITRIYKHLSFEVGGPPHCSSSLELMGHSEG